VADLGCGTGSLSVEMARLGHRVTGVDLAEEMVRAAREKALISRVDVEFLRGDAGWPPLSDASFDAVLVRHLAWTLPDPERAISRWSELLTSDGRLVMIEGVWGADLRDPGLPWGGGVSASVLIPWLERRFATVEHHPLTHDDALWGGSVNDERYAVVATALR
jgi:SAM-dependent methyltransferase